MTSDALRLSVHSDSDVAIIVRDGAGRERLTGTGSVAADLPRGLYLLELERCGVVVKHVIAHEESSDQRFDGPQIDSASPVVFARDAEEQGVAARRLSGLRGEPVSPGDSACDARLFVFVRRVQRGQRNQLVPSDPVAIHDLSGRRLAALVPAADDGEAQDRYAALSCQVAAGTYRLRVGRAPRDVAIAIPSGRCACVFLADRGTISIRTARVALMRADDVFEPAGDIARGTESVLWALGRPGATLPPAARDLLTQVDRDLAFAIACAHVLWRQGDRAAFEQIMDVLRAHASELPDVAILHRVSADSSGPSPILAVPPLLRASLTLALEHGFAIAPRSALCDAARAAFDDSVLCTWSPRWSDERWVTPTIEQLRARGDGSPATISEMARLTRLSPDIVSRAVEQLDAALPRIAGVPVSQEQLAVPGYVLGERLARGDRSTVLRARRELDGVAVAVKVVPIADSADCDRVVAELAGAAPRLVHPRMVAMLDCGVLPSGGGAWVAMEACRESLFERSACGAMPYDEACAAILQALDALGALHQRDMVHGAIDPGSVLVRKSGEIALGLPRLPIAVAADSDSNEVRFLAPEVAQGGMATAQSDVWSMAAALYFSITLELPRELYAEQSPLEAARDNPVIPIATRMPALPGGLAACVGRAMSPAVAARFPDGRAFHDALSSAVPAARAVGLYDDLVAQGPGFAATLRNIVLRSTAVVDRELVQRRVRFTELVFADAAENARVEIVLKRCQAANVITVVDSPGSESHSYIELAHPELLRGWSSIARWQDELDVEPETRSLLAALADGVRVWEAAGRARSQLWTDARITRIGEVAHRAGVMLNASETEFVRRSARHRHRVQVGVAAAVAALVVVSGCVVLQREMAIDSAAAETRQTLTRSLQEIGRQYVLDGRPLQALPYLVAARGSASAGPALQMLFHRARRDLPLTQPLAHDGVVTSAVFSANGLRVVTTSRDHTATVWNAATGARLASLRRDPSADEPTSAEGRAHDGAVLAAAFNPDGTRIATGSEDWTAIVWNAATGLAVYPPLQHRGYVQSVVFSPDGRQLLTASSDHTARIWNATTGALVHELVHRDAVMTAAFSPDGTRVVTASADRTAEIWDVSTGLSVHHLKHDDKVRSAAFSPDGTRVVTASLDRTARIWDTKTGDLMLSIAHPDALTGASFGRRGESVVTASGNAARVWNAASGAAITPWLEHRGAVANATFSPDGSLVITASAAGTARIWDARTGAPVPPMYEHTGAVTQAMFDPSGTHVVTASADGTARIWDVETPAASVVLDVDSVRAAALSGDGMHVVTVNGDPRFEAIARIWNTSTGRLERTLAARSVITAAFSPDGGRVVTTSADRTAQIWDAMTGQAIGAHITLPGRASSVSFSSDGSRFVTTSEPDGVRWTDMLRLWDAATGTAIPLPTKYDANVVGASLDQTGTRVATLDADRAVRVWDAVTGRAITPRLEQPGGVTSVAFSLDGTRIVTAGADYKARVWDAATGRLLAPLLEHSDRVTNAAFSPDGERVVTISGDRTVQVWDAVTGKPLTSRLPQREEIVAVAFTTDGDRLLTVDHHSVQTWDVGLDRRSSLEWASAAQQSPYVLNDGVLVARARSVGQEPEGKRVAIAPP